MSNSEFPDSPVEFGIFDWIEASDQPNHEIFEHKLRLVEAADKGGLFGWHIAEHQGTPLSIDGSPTLMLSAAIQRTTRIRMGALTFCLPWYNPLRIYNEICMLDQMSLGRIELGVGRGVSPYEAAYYGMTNVDEARERYRESLDIFMTACNSDVLDFEGKYFSYTDLELYNHPYQRPYPPLWFPSSSHESIDFTASHGYNTVINTSAPPELRELYEHYRETWVEHGDDPERHNAHVQAPKLGTTKHVVVTDTNADAERICRQALLEHTAHKSHLGARLGGGRPREAAPGQTRSSNRGGDSSFEGQVRGGFAVCGAPQTVVDMLVDQIKTSTVNYVMFVVSFGKMRHEDAEHSLDLITSDVVPAVRAALGSAEAG